MSVAAETKTAERTNDALFFCIILGIPTDLANAPCAAPSGPLNVMKGFQSDSKALKEAVEECANILNQSKKPVILGGMEIIRYNEKKYFFFLFHYSASLFVDCKRPSSITWWLRLPP